MAGGIIIPNLKSDQEATVSRIDENGLRIETADDGTLHVCLAPYGMFGGSLASFPKDGPPQLSEIDAALISSDALRRPPVSTLTPISAVLAALVHEVQNLRWEVERLKSSGRT